MAKGWKKTGFLMLLICLVMGYFPDTARAASKSVSSVTIRVGTDTGAGNHLPEKIDIIDNSTDTRDGTYAATNSDKYYVRDAEWVTSTNQYMKVGQEPKMRLYLYINDSDYAFRGTYSSSNVHVKGGTFVSARRSSNELEVVVKLNGIKGEYPTPSEATWANSALGRARWNADTEDDRDEYSKSITSGYYDVYLYRGSSVIKKLESYKGTSYNFYPYMTKAGSYTYKVRTVPYTETEKKYGTRSGWLESDELYIDSENVSDGSGQTDSNGITTDRVGWVLDGGTWYYRYPDGSYQKNSWLKINGTWYLFDASGKMLTGWQNKNGATYYLLDSGAMYSGWIRAGNAWYYLNKPEDGGTEGAMRTGWLVTGGQTYYLKPDGIMAEGWYQADGNWYYFYPGSGHKAVNTYIDTFYVDANGVWKK